MTRDRVRRRARRGQALHVDWDAAAAEKGGYATFMDKEIHDQPHAVADTLLGRTDAVRPAGPRRAADLRGPPCAPSTRSSSSPAAPPPTRAWSPSTPSSTGPGSPCEVELAHEFRYRDPVIDERTLVVSISQSGETMDTLMAVKHARELGALTISICNTHGSTIPRESDAVLYTHAGPEIAVASTKAFLAQITALLPPRPLPRPAARRRGPTRTTRSRS